MPRVAKIVVLVWSVILSTAHVTAEDKPGIGSWWKKQVAANRARFSGKSKSAVTTAAHREEPAVRRPVRTISEEQVVTPIPETVTPEYSGGYGGGYAHIGSPLYPVPRPGIPMAVGGTMITNPALDPHELLYPHEYKGLYPPFYHKTKRSWIMTPFGIYKKEHRKLMGTEVKVKYKSYISPFALYHPGIR